MVNARLCETARQTFFFASLRHFNFLDCETESRLQSGLSASGRRSILAPDLVESKNELVQSFSQHLAVTGNSILTQYVMIQNNCLSGTKTDVSVGFVAICGIQTF